MNFKTPAGGGESGLKSRRTCANYQHRAVRLLRRNAFRVPSPAPLFAHRRVLGATQVRRRVVARHAHVAPDALADIVDPAFLDLLRKKWIGNRRPSSADEIEDSAPNLRNHRVWRRKAPDA